LFKVSVKPKIVRSTFSTEFSSIIIQSNKKIPTHPKFGRNRNFYFTDEDCRINPHRL